MFKFDTYLKEAEFIRNPITRRSFCSHSCSHHSFHFGIFTGDTVSKAKNYCVYRKSLKPSLPVFTTLKVFPSEASTMEFGILKGTVGDTVDIGVNEAIVLPPRDSLLNPPFVVKLTVCQFFWWFYSTLGSTLGLKFDIKLSSQLQNFGHLVPLKPCRRITACMHSSVIYEVRPSF